MFDRSLPFVALAAFSCPALAQDHVRPPVFSDLGFEAALARSEEQGKLLIVDAMTSWCGPCKIMDKTTWVDPGLVAWVREHAIAVQLDMDVHTAVKERFAIRAFPTVVVLRGGVVFDTVVGLRDAAFMKAWFDGARTGQNGADQARAELARLRAEGLVAAHFAARVELFGRLVEVTAFEDGLAEGLQLWGARPADAEPRVVANLTGQLGQLARAYPPARDALTARRDALGPTVAAAGAGVDRVVLRDWITLNSALGETGRTAEWATGICADDAGAALLRAEGRDLFATLIARGAWRAAGLSLVDPVARVADRRAGVVAVTDRAEPIAVVPMIPLAPRAVEAVDSAAGTAAPEPAAAQPRVVPAIPLAPRPAKPVAEAKPVAGPPEPPAAPRITPAIPLAPRAAKPVAAAAAPADAPKLVPAIPMAPRVPAVPMTPKSATPVETSAAVDPGEPTWTNPSDPAERDLEVAARIRYAFRQDCADVYAALCAAGRVDEAADVASQLLEIDDSVRARAALVGRALEAGAIDARRAAHQAWLDQAGR